MAVEAGQAFIPIRPDLSSFGRDAEKQLGAASAPVEKSLKSRFKAIAAGIGTFAAVDFLKGSVAAARESQAVTAQTESVIKATGGAAGVTAKQVAALATALSKKTGIDDEAIQSGENLLLTFRNIGSKTFPAATSAITDMSVAMKQDMKSSAIQVGKALNDPIKGISALSRVGVTFTQQQKDQIKQMVAVGDTAGAQGVILGELQSEFGGAAEAVATPWDKAKVSLGNLQESIGTLLIPALNTLSTAVGGIATWFTNLSPLGKQLVGIVVGLAGAVFVIVKATQAWTAIQAALNVVMDANPIGLVVIAIAALIAGVILAYKKVGWFRDLVDGAFHLIQTVIKSVVDWVTAHWPLLLAILTGPVGLAVLFIVQHFDTIKNAATGAYNWVKGKVDAVFGFFAALPGKIAGLAGQVGSAALSLGKTIISNLVAGVSGLISSGVGFAENIAQAVKNVLNGIIRRINDLFEFTLKGPGPLPDLHVNLPDIPTFAGGGTFRAPRPGGAGLAVLHDREVVQTPDQYAAAGRSGPLIGVMKVDNGDRIWDGIQRAALLESYA